LLPLTPLSPTSFPYTTLFRSAPGDDKGFEFIGPQIRQQFEHRLICQFRVRPFEPRVPDRRQPVLDGLVVLRSGHPGLGGKDDFQDRKSTRLNSSHEWISYAVF